MAAPSVRVECFHESAPMRRVLVTVSSDASYNELLEAIGLRLGVTPELMCLGQTEASVMCVADLRDGDVLRVVKPAVPTAAGQPPDQPSEKGARIALRHIVKLVLTLAIFMALEYGFQLLLQSWSSQQSRRALDSQI